MQHETMGSYPDLPADYADDYYHGRGRHRSPTEDFSHPLVPPDSGWDPAEELAYMLRDTMEQQGRVPGARHEEHLVDPEPKTPREALVELTAELPPVKAAPRGHRKDRRRPRPGKIRVASHLIAAAATVIASGVSIFGGLIAYDPLRFVAAARTESGAVSWWPLLVFGPWLVASLSILRAALHQRRAFHSWSVLLVFSAIAMALCVAQAPKHIVDTVAAALPSLASLACFQQVVRQVTLTRPPRRTFPRHRSQPSEKAAVEEAAAPREGTLYTSGDLPQVAFAGPVGEAVAGGPAAHDRLSGHPRRFGWPGDRS
ncbi:DUF2637 domain-containing protein [Streptomyces sp. NRRL S-1022]|uniref:DUF2637 domain-containing protein n=1 Tax=Streptomyces sp. NRRL S-1022 TaxID=1463880 RepID=UPI0007C48BB6|nr:DUF2637 domain-containing protein [Streptomyces sp. NRRL S-1022]